MSTGIPVTYVPFRDTIFFSVSAFIMKILSAPRGFRDFFLQPMDGPEQDLNTQAAVAYCLAHPVWRLSLQTHMYLGIP